jgi:hypothetical protein
LEIYELEKLIEHNNIFDIFSQEMLQIYHKMLVILLQKGIAQSCDWKNKKIDFTDMLYLPCILKLSSDEVYDFLFIDEAKTTQHGA